MRKDEIPICIKWHKEILSDSDYWINFNDKIVTDYCSGANGRKTKTIDLGDETIPLGVGMSARNVSEPVREKYVTGNYQEQYEELIQKWEELKRG